MYAWGLTVSASQGSVFKGKPWLTGGGERRGGDGNGGEVTGSDPILYSPPILSANRQHSICFPRPLFAQPQPSSKSFLPGP
jgi:hypothetical protein